MYNKKLKHVPICFSLKLECEKLASEKIEIQRHYVMVSCTFNFCVERTHGHTINTTMSHFNCSNLLCANDIGFNLQTTPLKVCIRYSCGLPYSQLSTYHAYVNIILNISSIILNILLFVYNIMP